jgi:hypothetical protein
MLLSNPCTQSVVMYYNDQSLDNVVMYYNEQSLDKITNVSDTTQLAMELTWISIQLRISYLKSQDSSVV